VNVSSDLAAIAGRFEISGRLVDAKPFGNGHINATYLATYRGPQGEDRYIHQRINQRVFPDVPRLMHNIGIVTGHVRGKGLTIVPRTISTRDGGAAYLDDRGEWWRTYEYVDGASAHEFVETPERAYEVARAFGGFLHAVHDLDPGVLYETLPGFHDTYKRFDALTDAISRDPCKRAASAADEITFSLKNAHLAQQLDLLRESGAARVCVTHNDTKMNNVLIDDRSGQGVCVIDLDTVMPGRALYDFGDIVRTATTPVAEDEIDLSKVSVDARMFEAVVSGYLETAGDALSQPEVDHLVTAGKVITFESGIRFLADYLQGDTYFRVVARDHNLRRARTQFALVKSLDEREEELRRIVRRQGGRS
jgi:hypothetical protein